MFISRMISTRLLICRGSPVSDEDQPLDHIAGCSSVRDRHDPEKKISIQHVTTRNIHLGNP